MGQITEQQLLRAGSLALERSFVLGSAYLTDRDAAFAGGSFVEGFGSGDADVDIYAIRESSLTVAQVDVGRYCLVLGRGGTRLGAQDGDAEICRIHTVIPGTSIKVDVHYRTWDELSGLTIAICLLYQAGRRDAYAPPEPLPLRDLVFLHRLYASHDIQGSDRLARLRQEIGRERFLFLLHRRKTCSQGFLSSVLRTWRRAEWGLCAELAHDMAVAHFQAYTHLLGNTHYHPVWILPYARHCGVSECMVARLIRIMVDKGPASDDESRRFVLDCLDFIDDILSAGSPLLRRLSGYPNREAARAQLKHQLARQPRPLPEWETEYRRKAFGLSALSMREWLRKYADAVHAR